MTRERREIDRVWRSIVDLVMVTRDEWRRNVCEATGLPFTRLRALRRLAHGERTLRELAEWLGTDAPAATVIVNDLEARGLVTRREHPDDRRAKLVALTPAGRTIVEIERSVPDPAPKALAALTREDVNVLAKIFDGGAADERARVRKR